MSLKSVSSDIASFLFVVFSFYADIFALFPAAFRVGLWILTIALQIFSYGFKIKYEKKVLVVSFLMLCFVFIRNNEFINGGFMGTARFLFPFLFLLLMIHNAPSYKKLIRYMAAVGMTHVAGTYMFFFIPSLYSYMRQLWGYYPTGTSSGTYGYRAGFTNHYSHNGVVLVVTVLCFFAVLMASNQKTNFKKKLSVILFVVALFALIMTSKRAVLIFGAISMIAVFYMFGSKKKRSRFTLLLLGGIGVFIVLFFAYQYIPVVQHTVSRFLTIGDDKESMSRYEFWEVALSNFAQHPVFGIGWLGFRYIYHDELFKSSGRAERYSYMNAHNVYVQLLCETGIVGTALFIIVAVFLLFTVFKLIQYCNKSGYKSPYIRELYFSCAMQIMFLMYCFTGNCLYDITFPFYAIAAMFTLGCNLKYKKMMGSTTVKKPFALKTGKFLNRFS